MLENLNIIYLEFTYKFAHNFYQVIINQNRHNKFKIIVQQQKFQQIKQFNRRSVFFEVIEIIFRCAVVIQKSDINLVRPRNY